MASVVVVVTRQHAGHHRLRCAGCGRGARALDARFPMTYLERRGEHCQHCHPNGPKGRD